MNVIETNAIGPFGSPSRLTDHDQKTEILASAAKTHFTYDTLNYKVGQVRLLRFKRTSSMAIECEISNYDSKNRPPYTALSYAWAPIHPQQQILVNQRPMTTGNSLWQFLVAECYGEEFGAYFWIDQISTIPPIMQ